MEHQPRDLPSDLVPPPQVFHSTAHGGTGFDGRSRGPSFPAKIYDDLASILTEAARQEQAGAASAS